MPTHKTQSKINLETRQSSTNWLHFQDLVSIEADIRCLSSTVFSPGDHSRYVRALRQRDAFEQYGDFGMLLLPKQQQRQPQMQQPLLFSAPASPAGLLAQRPRAATLAPRGATSHCETSCVLTKVHMSGIRSVAHARGVLW